MSTGTLSHGFNPHLVVAHITAADDSYETEFITRANDYLFRSTAPQNVLDVALTDAATNVQEERAVREMYKELLYKAYDRVAKKKKFDNILEAVSFRGDANNTVATAAQAVFVWRGLANVYFRQRVQSVIQGNTPDTPQQFLAGLPQFEGQGFSSVQSAAKSHRVQEEEAPVVVKKGMLKSVWEWATTYKGVY